MSIPTGPGKLGGAPSPSELQSQIFRETGLRVTAPELEQIVASLDGSGTRPRNFRDYYSRIRVRPPALAGSTYHGSEHALRSQLAQFFDHEQGAGVPKREAGRHSASARLRGVLSPHIDFRRGGPVYTWAYRELVEKSDAELFVILGVAHQSCSHRFALTCKDFDTPLGPVRTDREYVERIADRAGRHLFDDELAHRTEHSIEFQVVFLRYLLGDRRDFSIVPILVGSFHDLMVAGIDPIENSDVRRFIDALRAAEAAGGKKVAYIGGIDLSHVGPEFGDPAPVDAPTLDRVRGFDLTMLDRAAANDPKGWFGTAAELGNRWRVCGLAATYTMLHAMGPARGRLLKYLQAVDERRHCCVSFASVSFETDGNTPDSGPGLEVLDRDRN